jgi:hypothetical protein
MRFLRRPAMILLAVVAVFAIGAAVWMGLVGASSRLPKPLSVPTGDREIAWLHNTSAGETWSLFVIGIKRIEMPVSGQPSGLTVDDSNAFPAQSTAVPELVISRAGFAGKLRIRWYKVTSESPTEDWVNALALRQPAPLAVIGGPTSDWAQKLAEALAACESWHGDRPLYFITTATIDTVLGEQDTSAGFPRVSEQRNLIDVYPQRSFRFCFSNSQMVRALSDYVLHDPSLRPGFIHWPELRTIGAGAAGPWNLIPALAPQAIRPTVFPLEWQDDTYSGDLFNQFREHLYESLAASGGSRIVRDPAFSIPYSVGGFTRPNAGEAAAVREILNDLPPPSERSLLVIPTGSSGPARRVLLALAERVPQAGRRLVAVTGDGFSVNTFYRDAEWAWPARSIPIPVVLFAHANPFGWDEPSDTRPPPGYRLEPKTTTEQVRLDTNMGRMICDSVFPMASGVERRIAERAAEVAERLRSRPDKFFDDRGNRRGLSGEHVVVVRPAVRYGDTHPGTPRPESVVTVFRREDDGRTWSRVGSVQVRPGTAVERSPAE